MYRRLTAMAAGALLFWTAGLHADWLMLDDFNGQGPLGNPGWYQTTPLENFYMGNGRLLAAGKAMALHQGFPAAGGSSRIRFEAYSGEPEEGTRDTSPQSLSAIVGAVDTNNYYEIKLLSDNLNSTDFYRLHFYTVLNGGLTNDLTITLGAQVDALRLDASFQPSAVNVSLQPFDRSTGLNVGAPQNYSFGSVPAGLANNPAAVGVGLAAQGGYVAIDNLEGFIIPEATTFISAMVMCLPLLRKRRRAR